MIQKIMNLLQMCSAPTLMRWLSECLDLHQGSLVLLLAQEVSCLNVHLESDPSVEHVSQALPGAMKKWVQADQ